MKLKNPKKTVKVLYLYMTAPLLLVAGMLWILASFSPQDRYEAAEAIDEPAASDGIGWDTAVPASDEPKSGDKGFDRYAGIDEDECSVESDCGVGETCIGGICINPLVFTPEPPKAKKSEVPEEPGISGAGWAAIIASIMGGLTGLLGAITQTVLAFTAARDQKRAT